MAFMGSVERFHAGRVMYGEDCKMSLSFFNRS